MRVATNIPAAIVVAYLQGYVGTIALAIVSSITKIFYNVKLFLTIFYSL